MDALLMVIAPVGGAITFAGVLGLMSRVVRWRQERREIAQRLQSLEWPAKPRWTCRRCKGRFKGTVPMGPVCRECWHALDEYLSEVA